MTCHMLDVGHLLSMIFSLSSSLIQPVQKVISVHCRWLHGAETKGKYEAGLSEPSCGGSYRSEVIDEKRNATCSLRHHYIRILNVKVDDPDGENQETRIQRAVLVCKSHLSSSATLHSQSDHLPSATFPAPPPLPNIIIHESRLPVSSFVFHVAKGVVTCATGDGNHLCERGGSRDTQSLTLAAGSWDRREEGRRRVLLLVGKVVVGGWGGGAKLWDVLWYKHVGRRHFQRNPRMIKYGWRWGEGEQRNEILLCGDLVSFSEAQRMLFP